MSGVGDKVLQHQLTEQPPYVNRDKTTGCSMNLLPTKRILRNWLLFHIIMHASEDDYISSQQGSLGISDIFCQTKQGSTKLMEKQN